MENQKPFEKLVAIIAKLRDPKGGCPWDREQTHASLRPYLLEESYEFLDAVDHHPEKMKEELGDVLLQVLLHSEIARERGDFEIDSVIETLNEKLIRRHPHVFGAARADSSAEVLVSWQKIKAAEGAKPVSRLDRVPKGIPALHRAFEFGKEAAKVNFDWPDAEQTREKVREEFRELLEEFDAAEPDRARLEEEFGDLLFSVAQFGRKLGINSELALQQACQKFKERFELLEQEVGEDLGKLTLAELDLVWERIKKKKSRE